MRILGDPNITDSTITVSNVGSTSFTDKLKTYQLADNMKVNSDSTIITMDFDTTTHEVDCVAVCGTDLTSNVTMSLSYSDTNIEAPDDTIVLPKYSTFNQVFFLDAPLTKRYWRITIEDTSLTEFVIGYIYIGKYTQMLAEYPHTPNFGVRSEPLLNTSQQEYGSKFFTLYSANWEIINLDFNGVTDILEIVNNQMNIDPVLVVEYEESFDIDIYRPKYGVLVLTEYPYPMENKPVRPGRYRLELGFEERF